MFFLVVFAFTVSSYYALIGSWHSLGACFFDKKGHLQRQLQESKSMLCSQGQ